MDKNSKLLIRLNNYSFGYEIYFLNIWGQEQSVHSRIKTQEEAIKNLQMYNKAWGLN